ncbi:hypothetical protein HDU84_004318, partial [Entophlyctis sp. JEL0112]
MTNPHAAVALNVAAEPLKHQLQASAAAATAAGSNKPAGEHAPLSSRGDCSLPALLRFSSRLDK